MIVYDSGLVVIIDVFFMILIWIWLLMIVYDSASLLIFSSMTLLGIWSLIIVFTSPVVLFTDPTLPPPQRGVGGTRALAHSITGRDPLGTPAKCHTKRIKKVWRAGRTGFINFCMMEQAWQPNPRARKAGQPTMDRQVRGAGIPPTGKTILPTRRRQVQPLMTHVRHWPRATYLLSLSRAFAKQFLAKDCVSVCHFDAPSNDHFGGAHVDVMQVCDYNPRSFIMRHGALLPPNFYILKT